jgi:4'-phosphopantetheinyl transferase EntD
MKAPPFAQLFDEGVETAFMPVAKADEPLFSVELASIANACPSRVAEFRAGRQCARMALRNLGMDSVPIPSGPSREPRWPSGIVGSISHTDTCSVAAVARRSKGYSGIGIDVETPGELDEPLWDLVCTPRERASITGKTCSAAGLKAKAIFSIKESVFKCQFPVTGVWLEFTDIEVELSSDRSRFEAFFLRDAGSLRWGDKVRGCLLETPQFVLSSAWIRAEL